MPSMPIIEPTSNSKGKHRILYVAQAASVTLRNVIVRRGYPPKSHNGGGIFNEGTLLLDGCIIAENSTDDTNSGGGIFNTGTLTLTSSVVRDNGFPAVSGQGFTRTGGGIHHKNGVLKIQDSEIVGNRAEDGGGAIFAEVPMEVTRSTLAQNRAMFGGALMTIGMGSPVPIENSTPECKRWHLRRRH
jgi:polymorphic membrane protein